MADLGPLGGRLLRLAQELSIESGIAAGIAETAAEDATRLETLATCDDSALLRGAAAALALSLHPLVLGVLAWASRMEPEAPYGTSSQQRLPSKTTAYW